MCCSRKDGASLWLYCQSEVAPILAGWLSGVELLDFSQSAGGFDLPQGMRRCFVTFVQPSNEISLYSCH
jgi:hypothetical protein